MSSYRQTALKQNYPKPDQIIKQAPASLPAQNPTQTNLNKLAPDQRVEPLLPPPTVLWAWLSYIYHTTGQWVLPPDTAEQGPLPVEGNIGSNANFAGNPRNFSQNTGLKKRPSSATATPGFSDIYRPACSTEFSYVNSPYFKEAERLIELFATRPIEPDHLFGCKLVFTLIIAWCQHPLFKDMSGRKGKWMTLAFERFARELKIRTVNLKFYLNELQETGLLIFDRASKHKLISPEEFEKFRYDCGCLERAQEPICLNFFRSRSLQEKNLIYYLKVQPSLSLPVFDPSSKSTDLLSTFSKPLTLETERGERAETGGELGKDLALSNLDLKRPGTNLFLFPKSFPVPSSCNDLNYNNDDVKDFNLKKIKSDGTIELSEAVESTKNDQNIAGIRGEEINNINSIDDLKNIENAENEEEEPKRANNNGSPDFNIKSMQTTKDRNDPFIKFIESLNPEQRAKFDFLDTEASFAGFERRDGRSTLDRQEALKFALVPQLTLAKIKEHYNQVTLRWLDHRCRKNPLGLLHWCLTQDCDADGKFGWEQSNNLGSISRKYPSKKNHKKRIEFNNPNSSKFTPSQFRSEVARNFDSTSVCSGFEQNAAMVGSLQSDCSSGLNEFRRLGEFDKLNKLGEFDEFESLDDFDKHNNSESIRCETPASVQLEGEKLYDLTQCRTIWGKVCRAIRDRYKRPDIAAKLHPSILTIQSTSRKAWVVIEQPWLHGALLLEEQALAQICFSQEFGSGYKLEIQNE